MSKFLDETGLSQFWEKIKLRFLERSETAVISVLDIDDTPTSNSTNLVTSGGVKAALDNKANKSEMSVVAGTDANADKTTITLKNGTSATVLTSHQDISGKADKATTLAGYGITDAKITSGTITLGNNTITPVTAVDDGSISNGKITINKANNSGQYGLTTLTDTVENVSNKALTPAALYSFGLSVGQALNGKLDTLVSGTNIKTINNESLLGSGNISISTELSSQYAPATTSSAPASGDTYETAVSKLHKVIVDNEEITSISLNELNNRLENYDENVVHKASEETISGNKTFTGSVNLGSNATATTPAAGDNDISVATTAFVQNAVNALPTPMLFKGSLGTGGTYTGSSLPPAANTNKGWTVKVITDGTYQGVTAKVGDTLISDGTNWILIPSGDEPSGTVTSIQILAESPISVDAEDAITSNGVRTITHDNSGITAGTYKSVTVDAKGHVTAGTNPTTLAGYGITDAVLDVTITQSSSANAGTTIQVDNGTTYTIVSDTAPQGSDRAYKAPSWGAMESKMDENELVVSAALNDLNTRINDLNDEKQDTLVSGTDIKTINNQSILGSGNIDITSDLGDSLVSMFSKLDSITPVRTIEYDIASTTGQIIFYRANVTEDALLSTVTDTLIYSIEVTGNSDSNIYAQYKVYAHFLPCPTRSPMTFIEHIHKNPAGTASLEGLKLLTYYYPKAVNNGYPYICYITAPAAGSRHIKIRVYLDSSNVSWKNPAVPVAVTEGLYNTTYLTKGSEMTITASGWITNGITQAATTTATVSTSLPKNFTANIFLAGEALTGGNLVYRALNDGKIYRVGTLTATINDVSTNLTLDPMFGVTRIINSRAINANIAASDLDYKRSINPSTPNNGSSFQIETGWVKGDTMYYKCTLSGSSLIPTGHITSMLSPGYAYFPIGVINTASSMDFDCIGHEFVTLNASGKVTHVNGLEIAGGSGGGDTNVIETVKVNGTALTPDANKAVNIDLSGYDKTPLIIEVGNSVNTVPAGTYASITTALSNGRKVFVKVYTDQGEGNINYCILPLVEKYYVENDEDSYYFSASEYSVTFNATILNNDDFGYVVRYNAEDSHNHGNIQLNGSLQFGDITVANGDKLVVTDASDNSSVARTSITFDGSTTTTALTPKGTWETFLKTAPVQSVNGQTGAVSLALGDTNVVETIKVNNTALTPVSKAVNITVPVSLDDLLGSSSSIHVSQDAFDAKGTYSKPNGGIPKTDLASAVQTSLGLADTALQPSAIVDNTSFSSEHSKAPSGYAVSAALQGKADNATTLAGYGITDAKIESGVITLGSNTITPLTSHLSIKTINNNTITGTGNITIATPGVLKTDNTTALTTANNESLSGIINLHLISKTGNYNDLIDKPTIPSAVTESTVSGWGFTKNVGTVTSVEVNGTTASLGAGGCVSIEAITGVEYASHPITATNGVVDILAAILTEINAAKVTIYSGTAAPSNSLGTNGDLYLQTS